MHDHIDYPIGEATFERPTLLSSCARAATAAEASFRVPYPNSKPRQTRVISLDPAADVMAADIAQEIWARARFYRLAAPRRDISPHEVALVALEGESPMAFSQALQGADLVMMVATSSSGAREAEVIGRLARENRVMTAAVVLPADPQVSAEVVKVMRASAQVLVVGTEADYVTAILTALRV